jgi:hypothetical protein
MIVRFITGYVLGSALALAGAAIAYASPKTKRAAPETASTDDSSAMRARTRIENDEAQDDTAALRPRFDCDGPLYCPLRFGCAARRRACIAPSRVTFGTQSSFFLDRSIARRCR